MTQTKLSTKPVAQIGEEIGLELGTQMVMNYQDANPTDVQGFIIGRDIINQILSQPGCAAIKFYNAINENGEKTLVLVGADNDNKAILEYSVVSTSGKLDAKKGIVADRIRETNRNRIDGEQEWWESD